MSKEIRILYQDNQTQRHICRVLYQTISTAFHICNLNKNLDELSYIEIKNDLEKNKNRDLTVIKNFFYNKYNFENQRGEPSFGNISQILQSVEKNHDNILAINKQVSQRKVLTFCQQIREIRETLLGGLVYYRNYFAHNFSEIDDSAFDLAILSTVLRLLELGRVSKEYNKDHERLGEQFKNTLRENLSLTSIEQGSEIEMAENKPFKQEDEIENVYERGRLDVIEKLKHELTGVEDRILKKIESLELKYSQKSEDNAEKEEISGDVIPEQEKIKPDKQDYEIVDESSESSSEITMISPMVLRQKLNIISTSIKSHYSNEKSFGARDHLLQLANIIVILDSEPDSFDKFIELEGIRLRTNMSSKFVKEQIETYKGELDTLFSNVLWSDPF